TRTRAIVALSKIDHDAVVPLCRALQHPEPSVAIGVIGVLRKVRDPAAIPSLNRLAQTTSDLIIRQEAEAAVKALGGSSQSAYDALVEQAARFYNNPNYLNPTYHDPIIWVLEGEQLKYVEVPSWALNEKRAAQLIADAITLDRGRNEGHVLFASNNFAQYREYLGQLERVAELVERGEGEASEADLIELRNLEEVMNFIRTSPYSLPNNILYETLERALRERRPEVAMETIRAIRTLLPPGRRFDTVPEVLDRAQGSDHRGVRFAASECIAFMNPRGSFPGQDRVGPNLASGLKEAGHRLALTVIADDDSALQVRALLRHAQVASFNEASAFDGVRRARSSPHDLIVLDVEMNDDSFPTAKIISILREGHLTKTVPILVLSNDERDRGIYEQQNIKVISPSIDRNRLRDEVIAPLFQDREDARSQGTKIAARAARAVHFLASRDNILDLKPVYDALVVVLENRPDSVRIPACFAVACLSIGTAQAPLVNIFQDESSSVELRVAALQALGEVNRGKGSVSAVVEEIFLDAFDSSNVQIKTAAARAMGVVGNHWPNLSPSVVPAIHKQDDGG
ncbi:MAG: HEAT repeat domain-containing protein, partial [Planctomycetota bacterium]